MEKNTTIVNELKSKNLVIHCLIITKIKCFPENNVFSALVTAFVLVGFI